MAFFGMDFSNMGDPESIMTMMLQMFSNILSQMPDEQIREFYALINTEMSDRGMTNDPII